MKIRSALSFAVYWADVAQAIGTGHALAGAQPIILNGEKVGEFEFGERSHSYVDAAASF